MDFIGFSLRCHTVSNPFYLVTAADIVSIPSGPTSPVVVPVVNFSSTLHLHFHSANLIPIGAGEVEAKCKTTTTS